MSVEVQAIPATEQKPNDKELNFRAFEAKKNKEIEMERAERLKLQRELEELRQRANQKDEEEDTEPYVDNRKLTKTLAQFGKQTEEKTESKIQQAVSDAIYKTKQEAWLEQNADFYDVLQKHAEKLMEKAPEVARTILQMPDNFERQKLVYYNIKTLGIDKPEVKPPSIQEKIDANRRMPYYQPSGVGAAPYAQNGDFSEAGQKNAYSIMQDLKARLGGAR